MCKYMTVSLSLCGCSAVLCVARRCVYPAQQRNYNKRINIRWIHANMFSMCVYIYCVVRLFIHFISGVPLLLFGIEFDSLLLFMHAVFVYENLLFIFHSTEDHFSTTFRSSCYAVSSAVCRFYFHPQFSRPEPW